MIVSFREVRFTLQFTTDIDSFDEGFEFGIQGLNSSREWIPIMYYASQLDRSDMIYIGDMNSISDSTVNIRGYSVPYMVIGEEEHNAELKICNDSTIDVGLLSFRWIQTVEQNLTNASDDLVFLDDVTIKYVSQSDPEIEIVTDNFNYQTDIR